MITGADLDNWFMHHPPEGDQAARYETIRAAARTFAAVVVNNTPAGPDQTTAIRKIREAMMVANAAIACWVPLRFEFTPGTAITHGTLPPYEGRGPGIA